MLSNSLSAQKHIDDYNPQALFEEGVILFKNQQYGAAQSLFQQVLSVEADKKTQRGIDALYYEAVSALYLGHGDGEAKIIRFVNEHPSSRWAPHANFLYANMLFKSKKFKDALAIYEKTPADFLSNEEALQMQFNMAYSHFQSGNVTKALPLFHGAMLNESPYRDAACYYYSHIQYANGKDKEALEGFEKIRNNPVYSKVVPSYIMQINYREGAYQKVIDEGAEAIGQVENKRKSEVAQIVADAYFQQKDYDKALTYYEIYLRHLSGKSVSREACYQMGVSKMMTGDYQNAIADLQRVAGDSDLIAQYASYYLANCYAKTDNLKFARNAYYTAYSAGFDQVLSEESLFDYARLSLIPGTDPFCEAVGLLDTYVADHPKSTKKAEAEEMAVYLLLSAKRNDDALERLERMRNKSSELQTVYNELLYTTGVDHYSNENYDKAQACFSKVLNSRKATNKPEACFWLGESAYALGDMNTAAKYLKQFKDMEGASALPIYPQADYDLGYIYYQKPDYEAATNCFRSFVQACDDAQKELKSDAYIRLGDCYYMDRSYSQAINYYDLATRIDKRNSDYAMFQQALCYGAQGKVNQKVNMLEDLMRTYPSSRYYDQSLFEMGNTYLVHGDKRSALAKFDKLIQERPRSSYTRQALMKVGMVYYNNNQNEQALTNLKRLVENYPNTDESREAMNIIRSIMMEQNKLDDYFTYMHSVGGRVAVSQKDSLAFANAENFYFEGRCEQALTALQYYFDNFRNGAYLLKAHQYASECAAKAGTDAEVKRHLEYILSQPVNDYTDQALLRMARLEYEQGNYEKAGGYYERLSRETEEPLRRLEALEGSMKSNFFLGRFDKAIQMGEDLIRSKDLTKEQVNQINHILGKSYYEKRDYEAAIDKLDKSAQADKSVYGAESAYYSAMASLQLNRYAEAENKIFNIADRFSSYNYWVARAYVALADVYVADRNYFQAKETLRSVIDNYKGEDVRAEACAKLAEVERLEPKIESGSNSIAPIEE